MTIEGGVIDKLVAATAGMTAAVYFLAMLVAWYRVFEARVPAHSYARRITLNRAIAWSALFVLFSMIVSIKTGKSSWGDPMIDISLIAANTLILLSSLASVKVITMASFGNSVLIVFGLVSALSGLLILAA